MPFLGGYVSSLEGNLFIDISLLFWWFQPHLKNMSQIGNLPQIGDENKKYLKPQARISLDVFSFKVTGLPGD